MNEPVANPFGAIEAREQAVVEIEQSRAIQEVQAAMVIAKKFPRDPQAAMDNILKACARPSLAELAEFAYPRGSTVVEGPSIRLAEAIAQNWGNIQFGIRELSQEAGESAVEAYAWDMETNTRSTKLFHVKHERHTRAGSKKLTDPRDVYEIVANQGARRLRACILAAVPGEVVDAARRACQVTLQNKEGAPEEQIKKLVDAFKELGVTREQIVKRLGHHLDSVVMAEVLQLRKIYTSIKDGMADKAEFFEVTASADELNKAVKEKARAAP